MAISRLPYEKSVTSVLIGASSPDQVEDNMEAIGNTVFSKEETDSIEKVLKG